MVVGRAGTAGEVVAVVQQGLHLCGRELEKLEKYPHSDFECEGGTLFNGWIRCPGV